MGKYKAYVVTVGSGIGVFTRWLDVAERINVPGARHEGYQDWDEAYAVFKSALERGKTRIVNPAPKVPPGHGQGVICHRHGQGCGQSESASRGSTNRAARDALIAATLEEVKRERQSRRASGARAGNGSTRSKASEPSTSSSPPTGVTRTEHGTDSEPARSPRYAHSLSYASTDTSPAVSSQTSVGSPATGSSALASSDRRSDVSMPSTGVTKHFPADFAARPRDRRTRAKERQSSLLARNPVATASDYATPPGSAQPATAGLGLSPLSSARPPPAATAPTSATRSRKIAKSTSEGGIQPNRPSRIRTCAELPTQKAKQYSSIETQTSPAPSPKAAPLRATASAGAVLEGGSSMCECEHPKLVCGCCGLPLRVLQSVANRAETATPVARPPESVACPAPRSPAAIRVAAPSPAPPTATPPPLPAAPPIAAPPKASSPAAPASPASFYSAHSTQGWHTPPLGPSERLSAGSVASMASVQEGVGVLVPSTPARSESGASVLHDTTFDPRSPIQRGTLVPGGSEPNMLVRPSPVMVPMNSLLFS